MRFLHLADVHLDTPFAGRTAALRRRLRQASREALARAFDCALAERVDAVLIAGDLFDGERLSFDTERFLLEQLARLGDAGVPLVYACGNHDPGNGGGRIEWPANVVRVADARPVRREVRRADGTLAGFVTAAGHAAPGETTDLSRAFPAPARDVPEVALLHTQVHDAREAEAHGVYAPSHLSHLRGSGYHYWALGHVHTRQCLADVPAVHYPGNLQGRTGAERGAKGGLLVDLADPESPRVEFRPFAPVRFETVDVPNPVDQATLPALVSHVVRAWDAVRGSETAEWMVRVVISGASPLARELEDEEERASLGAELAEALGALDVDVWARGVHPVPRTGDHRGRQDVLGEALRLAEAVAAGRATLSGLTADELASPQAHDDLEGYVRRLLADADGEILARLLARGGA